MLTTEVSRRLERELGLGQFPLVRRRLYSRLQRVCEQRGDEPLLIVSEVLMQAKSATIRDAGKWFCAAVVRRLTEAGYWAQPSSPNQTREQAQAVGKALADRFTDAARKEGL
jgi:hypothetical protein